MDWTERFSRDHPVNAQIKDTDVFLHGTSSKRYLSIKSEGFLTRKANSKHFGISQKGICFEKYDEYGTYVGGPSADFTESTIRGYCKTACRKDQSSEGVILQIKGKKLRKLDCPIYADWNKLYPRKCVEGVPVDVDLNASVISIIIVDKDIPFEYLEIWKRIPLNNLL